MLHHRLQCSIDGLRIPAINPTCTTSRTLRTVDMTRVGQVDEVYRLFATKAV